MSEHIVPRSIYYKIYGALMFFTALTVAVAFFDFGLLNTVIAVTIAVIKALLVILFFMHVRYNDHLTQIFAAAGFFWLVILLAFTLSDYMARDWLRDPEGWRPTVQYPAIGEVSAVSDKAH